MPDLTSDTNMSNVRSDEKVAEEVKAEKSKKATLKQNSEVKNFTGRV